jgi:hypothetical protein
MATHCVAALARPQRLEVVGGLVVQEREPVGAADADAAPMGAVDDCYAVGERLHNLACVVEALSHVVRLTCRGVAGTNAV